MRFYVADLETRNFDFQAYGATPEDAARALETAWRRHVRQYHADPGHLNAFRCDIAVRPVSFGQGYRDGEADEDRARLSGDDPRFDRILGAAADIDVDRLLQAVADGLDACSDDALAIADQLAPNAPPETRSDRIARLRDLIPELQHADEAADLLQALTGLEVSINSTTWRAVPSGGAWPEWISSRIGDPTG